MKVRNNHDTKDVTDKRSFNLNKLKRTFNLNKLIYFIINQVFKH